MDTKTYIDDLLNKYGIKDVSSMYVYGLGTTGRLMLDIFQMCSRKIGGVLVGKDYKTSDVYKGLPVKTIEEVKNIGTLLFTVKSDELKKQFMNESYEVIDLSSVEFYHDALDIWFEEYFKNKKIDAQGNNRIITLNGCRVLNPKCVSKNEWFCFLQEAGDILLPGLFSECDRIDEGAYELGEVCILDGDIVVDAGANLGVFSAFAAHKGAEICYAFEPMNKNFDYLLAQKSEYPDIIIPVRKALDNNVGEAFISCNGSESSMYLDVDENQDGEMIECTTLDEFVKENNIKKIDFIKADIEGAECNMLRGATNVLKEFAPKLAICTYHRPTDKQELTEIILNANPDYVIEYKWKKLYAHV